ncbi:pyridoxal phosphate-dependent decarboxylase family protein [Xanthovirga aplysinae]|uniref:pyridoxal phosphate-dependent decarboxylase family protein n=1 Tax=Xanthovirga aplysinae TaxID=2529853 RepID=UPI0012BC6F5B|nr:aminotransferase class I/II-fold pyridoxal phosphate-dependent enzyme [Xanthovirga aplysinae]MTI31666.1 aminotransferase class I/II-fold pyridoxal phosphate-dependent enzyme [Xanthovirga aplysinae]
MIDLKDFPENTSQLIEWIKQYYQNITSYPVKSQVKPKEIYNQLPEKAPQDSESFEAIMADFEKIILPGITHWQHPNFHAYFPANTSFESILGEILTASLGIQGMIWETSPAATELEEKIMEWLRDSLGLPSQFQGVIQDSASSATLVAILTAREIKTNFESNENGVPPNLRVYCSSQVHSSVEKGVKIAGIGRKNLVKIAVNEKMQLKAADLEKAIQEDINNGFNPCCVVAAVGTTGTLAIDPIKEIAEICRKYKIWLHIDAAYAGSALILPEYRWMIEGIEKADSFVFNPHKWLFTNFDCSAYFIKNSKSLIKTFDILPEYLKTGSRGLVNDYRDWQVSLGRRFRALKLWFVIRSFGIKGLQQQLRNHIQLSKELANTVDQHPDFELIMPPFLNMFCFRWRPSGFPEVEELNSMNKDLMDNLNKSGEIYLTHTKVNGQLVLRFVIGQTYVKKEHLDNAWAMILKEAEKLKVKS